MVEVQPPFDWLEDFRPRFDGLDRDQERIFDLIVSLSDANRLEAPGGQSLYSAFGFETYKWLEQLYFVRGLYDLIEAAHLISGEQAIGWPYPSLRDVAERFVELGEHQRARRLWRHHLALIKDTFWHYVSYRDRGFRMLEGLHVPESEQRREYENYVASLPEKKALMLEVMAAAREFFVRAGASGAELARLDRDIADINAEKRSLILGEPDARGMSEALFWEIVEGTEDDTSAERLEALPERLALFKSKAIRDFDRILREKWNLAYRSDVWALAYLLRGGCSDDAFMEFRAWLIMQGRDVFEGVLADPDTFDVTRFSGGAAASLSLLDAAGIAHEMRTGKPMPLSKFKLVGLSGPALDENDLAKVLPRVTKALAGR